MRQRMVTAIPWVKLFPGEKVVGEVPCTMSWKYKDATAPRAQWVGGTSTKGNTLAAFTVTVATSDMTEAAPGALTTT